MVYRAHLHGWCRSASGGADYLVYECNIAARDESQACAAANREARELFDGGWIVSIRRLADDAPTDPPSRRPMPYPSDGTRP